MHLLLAKISVSWFNFYIIGTTCIMAIMLIAFSNYRYTRLSLKKIKAKFKFMISYFVLYFKNVSFLVKFYQIVDAFISACLVTIAVYLEFILLTALAETCFIVWGFMQLDWKQERLRHWDLKQRRQFQDLIKEVKKPVTKKWLLIVFKKIYLWCVLFNYCFITVFLFFEWIFFTFIC